MEISKYILVLGFIVSEIIIKKKLRNINIKSIIGILFMPRKTHRRSRWNGLTRCNTNVIEISFMFTSAIPVSLALDNYSFTEALTIGINKPLLVKKKKNKKEKE